MNFALIDSHCHLQLPAYDADRSVLLGRLEAEGCGAIVVGTNLLTSRLAVKLAETNQGLWATIAVHPGHTHNPHHDSAETVEAPVEEFFDPETFSQLASSPKVVAVGETGLDYFRLPEDEAEQAIIKHKQKENFIAQIRFAKEHKLPLSMHVRDAHDDAWKILRDEGYLNGVMHCFTGTPKDAERYLAAGLYISFTGAITYPPRKHEQENSLIECVRVVPLNRLLIETDAPWLTPIPHRGERNEPRNVFLVAQKIAEIKKLSYDEVAEQTTQNAIKLFNLAAVTKP